MTVLPARFLSGTALAVSLLGVGPAAAQAPSDTGAAISAEEGNDGEPKLPRYHDSVVSWEHNVSAETVGVGDEVQSSNPTYTMGLAARGRFYLLDEPLNKLFLSANIGAYREITNSDATTNEGETSLTDAELGLVYVRRLRGDPDGNTTLADFRGTLTFPTSKVSFESGRYFAPGVGLGITQVTPLLRGRFKPDLTSVLRLGVGYQRWFARATVPTNPSLDRVRLTPDGRSLPGDQLAGSSLIRDQLTFSGRVAFAFGEAVTWTTDFGLQPAWKYDVQQQVEICGTVATGCATVEVGEGDSRYLVRTQFNTELSFRLYRGFSLELGYGNAANQIGPDGRRRGIFYSPDAGFYASLSFIPHELVSSPQRAAKASAAPHSL